MVRGELSLCYGLSSGGLEDTTHLILDPEWNKLAFGNWKYTRA